MITWTDSARAILESHNQALRQQLLAGGADPDEVAADLHRHIEEELTASRIHVATREDVQRVLARMGATVTDVPSPPRAPRPARYRVLLLCGAFAASLGTILLYLHYRSVHAVSFPFVVGYELGDAKFLPGDSIAIQQVLGSSPRIGVGQTYCVTGTYTLSSRGEATLALSSNGSLMSGPTPVDSREHVRITRGTGSFRLTKKLADDGDLHVSICPVDSGGIFGGVSFGQWNRYVSGRRGPWTDADFPYAVDFVSRIPEWGQFSPGDEIVIKSIRGDRTKFELGGTYLVEGTYTLASMDTAGLSISVTALSRNSPGAHSPAYPEQGTVVSRGSGQFSLRATMRYAGSFHISFNPPEGGESRGTVFFSEIVRPGAEIPGKNGPTPTISIGIGKDGTVSVDGRNVTDEQLEPLLVRAHEANADATVLIRADEATQVKKLGFIMDSCRKAGIARFSLQSR